MFPGVSTNEVEKAVENRRNNVKPSLPKVIGTSMDSLGQVTVVFEEEIMLPGTMNQTYWDALI